MLSNFEGIIIDVNVKRVKTIRLYISRNGQAKLSVPISCPKEEVMDFLHKNKEWLIGALERSKARIQKENQKTQHAMEQGEVFYYLGKKYVLHVEEHKQVKEISVRIEGENLVIEGFELNKLPVGQRLTVGDEVLLEVTQIGKECHDKCAIYYQVGECIMPKNGIFTRVLKGGKVKVGDECKLVNQGKILSL